MIFILYWFSLTDVHCILLVRVNDCKNSCIAEIWNYNKNNFKLNYKKIIQNMSYDISIQ
jgi:hypothetical protein